ncbi:MAG: hypothetical protein KDA41_16625 [Planctomycetales bacterium]|nr:hypothetical protein [Planctomycetales bacterium]
MRLPPEIELAERKREADEARRLYVDEQATKKAMRARGEPVREDFANRREFRAATARFRRGRS